MSRELKLWNGRCYGMKKHGDPRWEGVRIDTAHAYVAAYSRPDVRRVIQEYCGSDIGDSEIKNYWNNGCWGDSMSGVTPERGLWIEFGRYTKPVRVI